jgi:hypothetical protein
VDEPAEAIAAQDRTPGIDWSEWRRIFWGSKIEPSVRAFSVVVLDVRPEHRLEPRHERS